MKRFLPLIAALPLVLCSCSDNSEMPPSPATVEETAEDSTAVYKEAEIPFTETMEDIPLEHELSPADPLGALDIQPSGYFKPGVWTSSYTDDTGNFYIFDEDGLHGRFIPMADAEGVDFTYSIDGSSMTMFVGEELTPYSAELETTDEGHIIIHMTFLGTEDELTYLSGISSENFSFYPGKKLAAMAEKYYEQQTGQELVGVEYIITENDMVILNLYVHDENGWRRDVESYTVSMFSAAGWSSISCEPIDLSTVDMQSAEVETTTGDDIQDVILPESAEAAEQY